MPFFLMMLVLMLNLQRRSSNIISLDHIKKMVIYLLFINKYNCISICNKNETLCLGFVYDLIM